MAEASSCLPAATRSKVLSLEEKLEILKLIDIGTSYSTIVSRYGIGKSTVVTTKKNRSKLEAGLGNEEMCK